MRALGFGALALGVVSLGAAAGVAQGNAGSGTRPVDRQSEAELADRAKGMLEEAAKSSSGMAMLNLERYPGHYTMLTVRTQSGGAEQHAEWNDIFVVLEGEATEMVGGHMVDAKEMGGGETRGLRVDGAKPTPMHKGDVIHVAAGVPHQTVLSPGKTFVYYVIKVAVPKAPGAQ